MNKYLLEILGLIFVVLKLTRFIDWSWWFITMPFWAVPGIFLALCASCAIAIVLLILLHLSVKTFG